jgi:hypothetical protein
MYGKRWIAISCSIGVVLGVLFAVWIDDSREKTFAPDRIEYTTDAPITIGWDGSLWRFDKDIHAALMEIERQVGCAVLSPSGTGGQITMRMLDGQPCGGSGKALDKAHAAGTWTCAGGRAEIQFRDLSDPATRYPLILHELGHAMGLDHDDSGDSIMLPKPPPMVHGQRAPEFTRKDRKALKARFCP